MATCKLPQFEAQEGNWKPNTGYDIFEIPNQAGPSNYWQVSIPWLGSAISKDWSGHTTIPPLSLTPANLRPDMLTTFYGFRVMWFGWGLMVAVAMVAETGRQPWLVYGKLLTAAGVSPLKIWPVIISLTAFVLFYLALLGPTSGTWRASFATGRETDHSSIRPDPLFDRSCAPAWCRRAERSPK